MNHECWVGLKGSRTTINGENILFMIIWDLPSTGTRGLLSNVIIANMPQLILSMVYYTYNGIFTTFWLAKEAGHYVEHRKSLRVSTAAVRPATHKLLPSAAVPFRHTPSNSERHLALAVLAKHLPGHGCYSGARRIHYMRLFASCDALRYLHWVDDDRNYGCFQQVQTVK